MYAIVRTGGKQYKVKTGDQIRVELLKKTPGDEFDMEEVLFIGGKKSYFGDPLLSEAKVRVVVRKQTEKGKKILVFKKKRRHGYRKTRGHRQLFTELFVKSITTPDGEFSVAETDEKSEYTEQGLKVEISNAKKEKSEPTGEEKQ